MVKKPPLISSKAASMMVMIASAKPTPIRSEARLPTVHRKIIRNKDREDEDPELVVEQVDHGDIFEKK